MGDGGVERWRGGEWVERRSGGGLVEGWIRVPGEVDEERWVGEER